MSKYIAKQNGNWYVEYEAWTIGMEPLYGLGELCEGQAKAIAFALNAISEKRNLAVESTEWSDVWDKYDGPTEGI